MATVLLHSDVNGVNVDNTDDCNDPSDLQSRILELRSLILRSPGI